MLLTTDESGRSNAGRHPPHDDRGDHPRVRSGDVGGARVEVMGPLRVSSIPTAPSTVTSSVVAFLAVHGPGRVGRERMAFSLWPDRPEDRARRALSDALYRLRLACVDGAPWLVSDADAVWLADVDVDLWEFRVQVASGRPGELLGALDLHRGPLADGLDDEWLDLPRLAHHQAVIGLAERLAAALEPSARLSIAERWVEIDPLGTAAHHCLIETLLALDRVDAARRAVDRFAAVMAELGIDVDDQLVRWRSNIRDAERPDAVVALVGRSAERGRLVRLLDKAVEGRGRTAFVIGPSGIGKTRLLDELVDAARWREAIVLRVGCVELEPSTPFGPVDGAVAAAFDEFRALRAAIELPPDVRRALARFTPTLDGDGPSDIGTADAIVTALRWLAREKPVLMILDDVQWAGEEVWPLLARSARELADLPVTVVAAARDGDHLSATARSVMGELDTAGAPILHLAPLPVADVDGLLRAHGITDADAAAVHARSAGNPLVALVLASDATSERLDAVVQRRLARLDRLDAEAIAVIRLVAVLGRTVELDVLTATSDAPAVVAALAGAEETRLLVRRAGALEFEHDLIRQAVLDTVDDQLLRQLHRSALTAVATARPSEILRLLAHAEGAGDALSAATYALAAGTDALDQSAYRSAELRFTRVLELADELDDHGLRHLALAGRIRARDQLAERDGQRDDVTALATSAERLDDPTMRVEALRFEAEYRFRVGEYSASLDLAERAIRLIHEAATSHLDAELLRIASAALRELGRYDESARTGRRAAEAFENAGDDFGVAIMTDMLGGIAWRSGDPVLAAELHQLAADRLGAMGALGPQARSLNNVGTAMWALGDDRGAELVHERALTICRSLEDRQGEGDNLDNLGGVAFVRGEFEVAIDLYERALAIRRATNDPWGVSISLSNLGDAHRARGDAVAALAWYDESLEVNRAAGVVRNEATTLQARGLALVDLGRLDEARTALEAAAEMHDELGDRANLLQTWCGLLDLAVIDAGTTQVETLVERLAAAVESSDRALLREEVAVSLAEALMSIGRVDEARTHAGRACTAMDDALSGLSSSERARRRRTLTVHTRTDRLVERFGRRVTVHLAQAAAPLGVALADEHRVAVVWTIERPDDDATVDLGERRRRVLLRLMAEATAAGALATDDDLARACGVTRRTIQRDIDVLRSSGTELTTRRRGR